MHGIDSETVQLAARSESPMVLTRALSLSLSLSTRMSERGARSPRTDTRGANTGKGAPRLLRSARTRTRARCNMRCTCAAHVLHMRTLHEARHLRGGLGGLARPLRLLVALRLEPELLADALGEQPHLWGGGSEGAWRPSDQRPSEAIRGNQCNQWSSMTPSEAIRGNHERSWSIGAAIRGHRRPSHSQAFASRQWATRDVRATPQPMDGWSVVVGTCMQEGAANGGGRRAKGIGHQRARRAADPMDAHPPKEHLHAMSGVSMQ